MVNIKGTTVTMTRGDTVVLNIGIYDTDGGTYTPVEGDTIRFALKKTYSDAETLLYKDIPIDTLELRIDPDDTKELDAGPEHGKYVYDIELTKANGTVDTFIPRAKWVILEEVC